MRVILLGTLWLAVALDRTSAEQVIVPKNLTELVRMSQAAIVGRIVDFGDLTSVNDVGSRGQVIGTDVYASYRISIDEVLFNRKVEGPALTPGQVTTITQRVDKRDAELFVSRQFPTLDTREYLLFLWLRPGSESWSMLWWPYQFHRSRSALEGADTVSPLPDGRSLLQRPGWLGPSVTVVAAGPDKVVPQWASLVAEVKRLSGQVSQRAQTPQRGRGVDRTPE